MKVDLEITIIEIVLIRICVPILIGVVISAFRRIRRLEDAIMEKD